MKRYFISSLAISFVCLFILSKSLLAQQEDKYTETLSYTLIWSDKNGDVEENNDFPGQIIFEDAVTDSKYPNIPIFYKKIPVSSDASGWELTIEPLSTSEINASDYPSNLSDLATTEFMLEYRFQSLRGEAFLAINIFPFLKVDDKLKRLENFNLVIKSDKEDFIIKQESVWPEETVLARGNFYKFGVKNTGAYKITYQDLKDMGINVSSIAPDNIRLYGLPGGLLPEKNSDFRHTDIQEIPIKVVVSNKSKFSTNDYIIFYGDGPRQWVYNENTHFSPIFNYSNDITYYYLNFDKGKGKRIESVEEQSTAQVNTNRYVFYKIYEDVKYNLINSGRIWFSDRFDVATRAYNYNFDMPNRIVDSACYIQSFFGQESNVNSSFSINVNGDNVLSEPISGYSDRPGVLEKSISFSSNQKNLRARVLFNPGSSSSIGYMSYLALTGWNKLAYQNTTLDFRAPLNIGEGNVTGYELSSSKRINVWNVTNSVSPKNIIYSFNNNIIRFKNKSERIEQFIAFSDDDALRGQLIIEKMRSIKNLHSYKNVEYLIFAPEEFKEQAERLARIHRDDQGLNVKVVDPKDVYEEFSAGRLDISAIRDFIRMVYLRSNWFKPLRYVLMFGDASFDYRDINKHGKNFVPTWECASTTQSLISNYSTDDYFALLSFEEGDNTLQGLLDVGVGRFPVETVIQAKQAVDKVERYLSNRDQVKGNWRNLATFICDDEDSNGHLHDAEYLSKRLQKTHPRINVNKIYLDAYDQITTSAGKRAPSVNKAINEAINKGTFLVNYNGHGGEVGWAEEKILEISDINSWNNTNQLPLFITATCEFSRYDDVERTSAGEYVFLNPKGGAIALFSTSRATYKTSNLNLNTAVLDTLFSCEDDKQLGLGEVLRRAKNNIAGLENKRKFILLGDPALCLVKPEFDLEITEMNGKSIESTELDTIKALSKVDLKGIVKNSSGNLNEDFSGELTVDIYDKKTGFTTKGDGNSSPELIKVFNSKIYSGRVNVDKGEYSFSFMVPKDINYSYDKGRISLYAKSLESDAAGSNSDITVGGFNDDAVIEYNGPDITLYMNDSNFLDGDYTDRNPVFIADVFDESGINTTGAGIGHDILAVLDNDKNNPIVLNNYYQAEIGSYQRGKVAYQLTMLEAGRHTISLKIWDAMNNSSTKEISFVVASKSDFVLKDLKNYPNPMSSTTHFSFNHNQVGDKLRVEIRIYDIMGKLMRVMKEDVVSTSYSTTVMSWNGCLASGSPLSNGIYVYTIDVENLKTGTVIRDKSKLIINR
ncbi:MAG: type IX secretion system sortase PorU [Hyphomicrobiales bacterium]